MDPHLEIHRIFLEKISHTEGGRMAFQAESEWSTAALEPKKSWCDAGTLRSLEEVAGM